MSPPSILMTGNEGEEKTRLREQRISPDSIKDSTKKDNVMRAAKLFAALGKTSESRSRTRMAKLLAHTFLYSGLWLTSLLFIRQIPRPLQQFWINVLFNYNQI